MAASTNSTYNYREAVRDVKSGETASEAARRLLSTLTESERLSLLDGDVEFYQGLKDMLTTGYNREPYVMGAVQRAGIPGVRFTDGPRGVVMGQATAFPVPMARGATWDTSLETRVGDAIGAEAKAGGANLFAGVCINLPRHPAWGRIQETYGEDPLLLGDFGVALTQSVQKHVMACVKHYALNSMENARFQVDVKVEEDVLREVYLPHFRRVIEAGAASVMSSYNSVNGEWAGQNKALLDGILRGEWNFDGFVMSDFMFGLRDAVLSVKNGLDIEAPFVQQRAIHLKRALDSGDLTMHVVDKAGIRILQKEIENEVLTERSEPKTPTILCQKHLDLAREVATKSIVLLKNENAEGKPLLPLDVRSTKKIAVVGRLSNVPNTGDHGSSKVTSPKVVTVLEGIQAALPDAQITCEDTDSLDKVKEAATNADVVVCVVGYDWKDEGEYMIPGMMENPGLKSVFPPPESEVAQKLIETMKPKDDTNKIDSNEEPTFIDVVGAGGDRKSLGLRQSDIDVINTAVAANSKTIVSIVCAGAVMMEDWKNQIPAILLSWYGGAEGGHGLADVLFGRTDVSGRLPYSIPTSEDHLPAYDMHATEIRYERWFGQCLLDKLGVPAAFPLGFGLSYTTFSMSDLEIGTASHQGSSNFPVNVKITNTGSRPGRHIVQVYGQPGLQDFPNRVLLGFAPVDLKAGETKQVSVAASPRPMQRWKSGRYVLPENEVVIEAASFSGDPKSLKVKYSLAHS